MKAKTFAALLISLMFSMCLTAQDMAEAKSAYNAAITANTDGNIEEAIAQFTTCMDICQTLYDEEENEEAEELLYTVMDVVPKLYYGLGKDQLKEKKFKEGIASLTKAKELAGDAGDDQTFNRAGKLILQVYYKLGASKYKAKDYEAAHGYFDKAIAEDADYAAAYYLKAVTYKKQGMESEFKSTALKGIVAAKNSKDNDMLSKIKKLGTSYYLKIGNDAKGSSKYDEAITNLNSALEFNDKNSTVLYLLASTYLAKEEYSEAVTTGQKAVDAELGGEEAKAKIYMIIAEAQKGLGDKEAACASYNKAAVGQYAENANWHIEHDLKCNE